MGVFIGKDAMREERAIFEEYVTLLVSLEVEAFTRVWRDKGYNDTFPNTRVAFGLDLAANRIDAIFNKRDVLMHSVETVLRHESLLVWRSHNVTLGEPIAREYGIACDTYHMHYREGTCFNTRNDEVAERISDFFKFLSRLLEEKLN